MKRILLILALILPFSAQAVTFNVNCDKPGPIGKISTYLKLANALDATTIKVSGTCPENIQINSLDRLSLIAMPGATLQDASNGAQPVILITDSRRITVQGFTITGGTTGISCVYKSLVPSRIPSAAPAVPAS